MILLEEEAPEVRPAPRRAQQHPVNARPLLAPDT